MNDPPRGSVQNLRHKSSILSGNPLGDSHVRELFIYRPPGYDEGSEKYPTVYCLTGFTGRGKGLLNDNAFYAKPRGTDGPAHRGGYDQTNDRRHA